MAVDRRRKNVNWVLPEGNSWDSVKTAVLMDIRDELQTLNALLACRNFTGIPATLRGIRKDLKKEPK